MNENQSELSKIERRAELIAELFLQDLNPSFLAKPTEPLGYDFLVGFRNAKGGIDTYIVEVKATERPVSSRFPITTTLYQRLVHSNIPALLLFVDVKQNRLFYARFGTEGIGSSGVHINTIPVTEVDDVVKQKLRRQLGGEISAGKYEIKKSKNALFFFNLKAANGKVILTSQMYAAKSSAVGGIESVRKNAPVDSRYERKTSTSGQPYFLLKAANGEALGKSETYSSTAAMENGIESVKKNAPEAKVDDLT